MKKLFTALLAFSALVLCAGNWVVDTPQDGVTVLRNEEGRFTPGKSVLFMCGNGLRLRKTFDLSKLPEGVLANAKRASLRVFCNVTDYNWGKDKTRALDESVRFVINGNVVICKTSDPRFSKKKDIKAPQHFKFADIDFPVSWIKNGQMVVVINKMSGGGATDFFYQGVDITSPTNASEVSSSGGAKWGTGGCITKGKGEGIVRLVLYAEGDDIIGTPGDDISTDRDISQNNLILQKGAAKKGKLVNLPGTPGNRVVFHGSGLMNISSFGFTYSGIFRFNKAPEAEGAMLFCKDYTNALLCRDGKFFFLTYHIPTKSWKETELSGTVPAPGKFFHIALVFSYDKAQSCYQAELYLDGRSAGVTSLAGVNIRGSKNGMGVGSCKGKYNMTGDIAEVSCFNRVLSAEDIDGICKNSPFLR